MASQDVPADQLDARISGWASRAKPEDSRLRVAGLLGAPLRSDAGMPAQLALSASSAQQQLAVETTAQRVAPAVAVNDELPPAQSAPVPQPRTSTVVAPVVAPRTAALVFVANPVIQRIPSLPGKAPVAEAKRPSATLAAAPGRVMKRPVQTARPSVAPAAGKGTTHAVQLGSFFSEQGARRAWGQYVARNPELRGFKMVITTAQVRGKTYWRVAAGGFDGRGAGGLCSKVKARGGACFAYATTTKPSSAPAYASPAYASKDRTNAPVMALNTGLPGRKR